MGLSAGSYGMLRGYGGQDLSETSSFLLHFSCTTESENAQTYQCLQPLNSDKDFFLENIQPPKRHGQKITYCNMRSGHKLFSRTSVFVQVKQKVQSVCFTASARYILHARTISKKSTVPAFSLKTNSETQRNTSTICAAFLFNLPFTVSVFSRKNIADSLICKDPIIAMNQSESSCHKPWKVPQWATGTFPNIRRTLTAHETELNRIMVTVPRTAL